MVFLNIQDSLVTINMKDGHINAIVLQIGSADDIKIAKVILMELESFWYNHESNKVKES